MRQLVHQLLRTLNRRQSLVWCALVETRGSTPQKAGAVMLVFADGSQAGTLGGGCVEAEVKRRALELLLGGGSPTLMTFSLDKDYGWDDGLICGGRMTMLVDPVRSDDLSATDYFGRLADIVESGAGCTEAVMLDARHEIPEAARFLLGPEGATIAQRGTTFDPPDAVAAALVPVVNRPRPYQKNGVSFLPTLQTCRLVIVGAGHVGQQVCRTAAELDFQVTVIDDRADYCNPQHLTGAQNCIVGPIDDTLPALETDESTFCLIVTRGHNHDEEALFHLINKPSRYIGMIGSRRKIRLIFDDLQRRGISEEQLAQVHAPVGIDIGSQTVPEIAISVLAELIAVRNTGAAPQAFQRDQTKPGSPTARRGA